MKRTPPEQAMAGSSAGDDFAALRAELTQILPSLHETVQWRSSVGKVLENEVQELVNAKMSLMGDITGLQADVASLRRELSAYDADLKSKLNLSEKGLLAQDKELKDEVVEMKGQIGVIGATVSALQTKATTIDDIAQRLAVMEAGVAAAGVNWPALVSRIEAVERGGVGGVGLEQRFALISNRLDDMDLRVTTAEGRAGDDRVGGRSDRAVRSFLPEKSRVPKTYGGKLEEWPDWKSDVEMWFDGCAKGLGVALSRLAADNSDEPINGLFMARFHDALVAEGTSPMEVMSHDSRVYEALKGMTDQEALATVRGVIGGRGFEAWRRICQQFEPGVAAARHGAFHRVTAMGEKPAKTTTETRRLLVELDNRLRVAREVQGREVADDLSNAVLEKMLDPTTRAFTGSHFGKPYTAYRREVMRFLNENMSTDTRMQIGAVTGDAANEEDANDEGSWDDSDGYNLAAIRGACWTCGVIGHAARDCPQGAKGGKAGKGKGLAKGTKGAVKGKGKSPGFGKGGSAKGGGLSGGKGKSAPPRDGCLICWGPHWARECPQRTYSFEHSAGAGAWSTQGTSASNLCNLRTIIPKSEQFERTESVDEQDKEGASQGEPGERQGRSRGRWRNAFRGGAKRMENPKEPGTAAITGAKFFRWIADEPIECAQMRRAGCRCSRTDCGEDRVDDVELVAPTPAPKEQPKGSETVRGQKSTADGSTGGNGCVSTLTVILPEGELQAVKDDGWELVEAAVDSGATENVMSERVLQSVKTTEGESSRRGVSYEVANGVRIPNLGEKKFVAVSAEGVEKGLTCQICDVNRPLLSVSKIVNAGHKVTFTNAGSWIEDERTGEVMELKEDGGMYTLQMWVRTGAGPGF